MKYPTTEAGWWQSEFETTCELLRAERERNARLTAVAEAARALHELLTYAKNPSPEWSALGAALKALDGSDRG